MTTYQDLTVYDAANQLLWSYSTPATIDMIAGMCAALRMLFPDYQLQVVLTELTGHQSHFSVAATLEVWSDYLRELSSEVELVASLNKIGKPWGWILVDGYDRNYLAQFADDDFWKGYLLVCAAWDLDFRDFSRGTPWQVVAGRPVWRTIPGYDVQPLLRPIRNPAVNVPYYTGVYLGYSEAEMHYLDTPGPDLEHKSQPVDYE